MIKSLLECPPRKNDSTLNSKIGHPISEERVGESKNHDSLKNHHMESYETATIFTAKIFAVEINANLAGIEIKAVIWLWIDKLALRCTAVTILSIVPAKFTQDLLRVCGVVRETWRLIKRVRS
ncbi:hypothetical protein Tco_0072118 [Tanacetum coccineum]